MTRKDREDVMDRTNVERILTDAREAVAAAEVPEELRPLAFEKAVDLLAGSTPAAPAQPAEAGVEVNGDGGRTDQRLAKIAQRLGVEPSKLAYIFDPDTDDVALIVQRSKLASSKAKATREVALLYSAARQAAGYDETHTSIASIKTRVEDMGVLDENNFASHVKNTDGLSQRGQTPSTREYKVTQHGFEEAGKIINRVTGGGS
jgi:hypothetical protein